MSKQKGYTVVEVLVCVALIAIAAAAIAAGSEMIFKSSATSEKFADQTFMIIEANRILGDQQLCTAALQGKQSSVGADVTLSDTLKAGLAYANKINIASIKLQNITAVAPQIASADVEIKGSKIGDVFGSRDFSRSLRVYYQVDGANVILNCFSDLPDQVATCTNADGVWDAANSRCDFCATLGGTELPNGSCSKGGGGPPPPPPPVDLCQHVGEPCANFTPADWAATYIVDYCGCRLGIDYTVRCTAGLVDVYALPCYRFGNTCVCR